MSTRTVDPSCRCRERFSTVQGKPNTIVFVLETLNRVEIITGLTQKNTVRFEIVDVEM
jgi:hypothetical protein